MQDRNKQKTIWAMLEDIIYIRTQKKVKDNGCLETDAEVINRIVKRIKQDQSKINSEIKFDKKRLFK